LSDIIREAETTIVLTKSPQTTTGGQSSAIPDESALIGWGVRAWTLPEVILSRGDSVLLVDNGRTPKWISKIRLAENAWRDAENARQLVEHFTTIQLSRLELVSIALQCLRARTIREKYPGDRSYALMGLLRIRPQIDYTDSDFQAFAR
jgi:hypothetical protein